MSNKLLETNLSYEANFFLKVNKGLIKQNLISVVNMLTTEIRRVFQLFK